MTLYCVWFSVDLILLLKWNGLEHFQCTLKQNHFFETVRSVAFDMGQWETGGWLKWFGFVWFLIFSTGTHTTIRWVASSLSSQIVWVSFWPSGYNYSTVTKLKLTVLIKLFKSLFISFGSLFKEQLIYALTSGRNTTQQYSHTATPNTISSALHHRGTFILACLFCCSCTVCVDVDRQQFGRCLLVTLVPGNRKSYLLDPSPHGLVF